MTTIVKREIEKILKNRKDNRRIGNLLVLTVGSEICKDVDEDKLLADWISYSFNKDKKLILISIPHKVGSELEILIKEAFKYYIDEIAILKYKSEIVFYENVLNSNLLQAKEFSSKVLD